MSLPGRLREIRDAALAAALVRESPAFFAREIARAPGIHVYRPRSAGEARIAIRHGSGDRATLDEVFGKRLYHPPRDVASALGSPRRIVDLGANIGLFGAFAAALWPLASIVGYELDPASYGVHQQAIAANGLGERWSVRLAAAATSDGEVRVAARANAGSTLLADGESDPQETVVAQHDVLAELARCDLVKIDIEGGEWAILADPRFQTSPPRALVMEYHPEGCPGRNPREEATRLLAAAGMRTLPLVATERGGVGMLWALRTRGAAGAGASADRSPSPALPGKFGGPSEFGKSLPPS